jgi:hypothetical protein
VQLEDHKQELEGELARLRASHKEDLARVDAQLQVGGAVLRHLLFMKTTHCCLCAGAWMIANVCVWK